MNVQFTREPDGRVGVQFESEREYLLFIGALANAAGRGWPSLTQHLFPHAMVPWRLCMDRTLVPIGTGDPGYFAVLRALPPDLSAAAWTAFYGDSRSNSAFIGIGVRAVNDLPLNEPKARLCFVASLSALHEAAGVQFQERAWSRVASSLSGEDAADFVPMLDACACYSTEGGRGPALARLLLDALAPSDGVAAPTAAHLASALDGVWPQVDLAGRSAAVWAAEEGWALTLAMWVDRAPLVLSLTHEGGRTLLHLAAHYGQWDCVAVLLAAGANPSAMDEKGNTAAHLAIEAGAHKVIKTFVAHGVRINVPPRLEEMARQQRLARCKRVWGALRLPVPEAIAMHDVFAAEPACSLAPKASFGQAELPPACGFPPPAPACWREGAASAAASVSAAL